MRTTVRGHSSRQKPLPFLLAALVAVTFLTGGHCGNEVTAPQSPQSLVTPTPAPTAVPLGLPASLHGALTGFNGASGIVLVHGYVKITQGNVVKTAYTNATGQYEMDGLQSGPAGFEAIGTGANGVAYQPTFASIVLVPGRNTFGVELHP